MTIKQIAGLDFPGSQAAYFITTGMVCEVVGEPVGVRLHGLCVPCVRPDGYPWGSVASLRAIGPVARELLKAARR